MIFSRCQNAVTNTVTRTSRCLKRAGKSSCVAAGLDSHEASSQRQGISKSISRIIVTGSVQCRFVAVSCFGLVLCFFDQAGCIILGVNIKLICLSICFGWVRSVPGLRLSNIFGARSTCDYSCGFGRSTVALWRGGGRSTLDPVSAEVARGAPGPRPTPGVRLRRLQQS